MALLDAILSSSLIPVTVAPSLAIFKLVLATIVVPVIAAAVEPPITELSRVPPLMSAVVAVSVGVVNSVGRNFVKTSVTVAELAPPPSN